jgi:hypothetical protein
MASTWPAALTSHVDNTAPKMNATGGRTEIRISSLLIEPYRSAEIVAINPNKETLT